MKKSSEKARNLSFLSLLGRAYETYWKHFMDFIMWILAFS